MSMISSLIDELNKSADEWNGSNMFELARMCREAADTIWQLRDDLQRANTENAKLRELAWRLLEVERIGATSSDWREIREQARELGGGRMTEYVTVWRDHEPTELHWGVPVVRCRDCKHAQVRHPLNPITGIPAGIEDWRCDYFWNADELPEVEPDGFCAWGERRDV